MKMHTTAQASVGPLNRMMLGFYETTINGHRAIAHGGDTMWFHSDLQLFPDDGIGIYVSTNSAGKDGAARNVRASLVTGFADRYLPLKGGLPASTVDAATAKLHAQQIAGAYMSSRRPQTTFMSILNPAGLVKVIANEDGTISVPHARQVQRRSRANGVKSAPTCGAMSTVATASRPTWWTAR